MYDYAGEWGVRVGMPAKSGVSGGISAVKPGQFGIGLFSPRLDEAGNSSRGVAVLTMLSQQYGLSLLQHPPRPASPIHRLEWVGDTLTVGIRGDLDFVDLELVVHEIAEELVAGQKSNAEVSFDLTHVTSMGEAARMMFDQLRTRLQSSGYRVTEVDPSAITQNEGDAGALQ
jgi:glutaminase